MGAGAAVPLDSAGAPRLGTLNLVVSAGSLDGEFSREDRLSVLQGQFANPRSLNQIEVTPGAARLLNLHVGEKVPYGFYNPNQENVPGFGTPKVKPVLTVYATVTGIVELNSEIVQDDVDRAYGFVFITPAMTKRAASIDPEWTHPAYYAIQLRHGHTGIATIESQLVTARSRARRLRISRRLNRDGHRRTRGEARVRGPRCLRTDRGARVFDPLRAGALASVASRQ